MCCEDMLLGSSKIRQGGRCMQQHLQLQGAYCPERIVLQVLIHSRNAVGTWW